MSETHVFNTGDRTRIEFRIQAGRIDCDEGPSGQVTVDVSGRGADAVRVEQDGDTIVVYEERTGWIRGGAVRIQALLPSGADIEMAGASTDLYVQVDAGDLVVKCASGDVAFAIAGALEVKTASGDVRGEEIRGDARIGSASGDVYLDVVRGNVSASLASGDVSIERVEGDLRINSASGDVAVGRFHGSDVALKSVSGDLVIGFPRGIRLDANVNTLSGDVRLPEKRSDSTSSDRPKVRFEAKTVSGDVRIEAFDA
jgi:hypothetical protein